MVEFVTKAEGKIKPRSHQLKAIRDVVEKLTVANRTTAVMGCGTGKTLVGLWVAESIADNSIVLFFPSLALLGQTLCVWQTHSNLKNMQVICICSDDTVADEDEWSLDLTEYGVTVTTTAEEITNFLNLPNQTIKIVFCTYQSSEVLAKAMPEGFRFCIGIFDEAHKSATARDSYFSTALFDDRISIKKRLFMTATPKHFRVAKDTSQETQNAVFSMDNVNKFGEKSHVLTLRDAIIQNIICDYKILTATICQEELPLSLVERGAVFVKNKEQAVKAVAKIVGLEKAINVSNVSKILCFHTNIRASKEFVALASNLEFFADFKIFHIDGSMNTNTRKEILERFLQTNKGILSNARCLTEGVDLPEIGMVAFMSSKKSKIDIIQAIGRAIRKNPNKEYGYVFLPIFLEGVDDVGPTNFQELYEVINAIKETDPEIEMLLNDAKRFGLDAIQITQKLKNKLNFIGCSIPTTVAIINQAITVSLVERLGDDWYRMYGKLCEFHKEYRHCRVLARYKDKQLAIWIGTQRTAYKKGKLTQDKVDLLDVIGFAWDVDEECWQNMYQRLVEFYKEYEHCCVPSGYKDKQLARWVNTQRAACKAGKLSQNKIDLLRAVGFLWDTDEECWQRMYQRLVEFYKEYGHCRVVQGYEDKQLAGWVKTQRAAYKKEQLSQDKIDLLNAIGFVWDADEERWKRMYQRLVEFHKEYGHCHVSSRYKDKQLVSWVNTQRTAYKKGKLSQDKIDLLNAIGFVWSVRK